MFIYLTVVSTEQNTFDIVYVSSSKTSEDLKLDLPFCRSTLCCVTFTSVLKKKWV